MDLVVLVAGAGTIGALVYAVLPIDPLGSALGASLWVLAGFVAVHLFVVAFWSLVLTIRKLAGLVADGQTVPELNRASYANLTAVMVVVTAVVLCAPQLKVFA